MQVVALHADATYTVRFGDGTNLTGVCEACFAAAPAAAKAPTVLARERTPRRLSQSRPLYIAFRSFHLDGAGRDSQR